MPPFLVSVFEKPSISNLVKECFGSEFPDVYNKVQVDYLFRYLNDLKAQTVLLEYQYVDKDYLEDHSRFYVRRFGNRGHKCARLHFFSNHLRHEDFVDMLRHVGSDEKIRELQDGYLGFIVVKPLPKTFVGRTCLRLYPAFDKHQTPRSSKLALRRDYSINLFGIRLSIQSVAFQEQDKVIAACATTSIWSALNALPWLEAKAIPSCCRITTNAINHIPDSTNSFPSKELSIKQILRAIDAEGLRHRAYDIQEEPRDKVLSIIKSHIDSGLPLLLTGQVCERRADEWRAMGGHAITVLGYKVTDDGMFLYVHDDRLGPFARARLIDRGTISKEGISADSNIGLELQGKSDEGQWQKPHEVLLAQSIISISDKSARLPVDIVWNTCDLIRKLYMTGCRLLDQGDDPGIALEFDIRLMEARDFKSQLLDEARSSGNGSSERVKDDEEARVTFLTTSFARFQWVCRFVVGGKRAFTMLVDASEIPQGDAVSAIYIDDSKGFKAVESFLNSARAPAQHNKLLEERETFIASFMRRLRPERSGLQQYLDERYGEPRAPSKLRPSEIQGGELKENTPQRFYFEASGERIERVLASLEAGSVEHMLWVIDDEGSLLIGEERNLLGHPSLTGFKPARIGGEIRKIESRWVINADSGRYSKNYPNSNEFLKNALERFRTVFHESRDNIEMQMWNG